ncbi:MAG TPA: NAD-dependent epimerase/dehydratase family protein [Solirubrobacteraceae bacterium]|jgi:UDP-glucose 4-epimerase|nr:NAD-dependent epimerase/dehydratase family protein [Solirubrobacteraceae bacterium]
MPDTADSARHPRLRALGRVCITGGAGFIGSNLAERLCREGVEVVLLDDFRRGRREFLASVLARPGVSLVEGDVLDARVLEQALEGCDWVFHLQANADVRGGLEHPRRDLEQNTIATSNVLQAMCAQGVGRIAFASTGSVYGEPRVFPTPEHAPFPLQTSLYGASKLAGEGLICAYAAGYGFTGVICRYVSILGERYTHGHLFDFYRALKAEPARLLVCGDGTQEKSYLYVRDCVEATLTAALRHNDEAGAHVYNVGSEETHTVDDSIALVAEHLSVSPQVQYTGGPRGWVGDSPLVRLDTQRLASLGWRATLTIREAALRTLQWFDANEFAWREDARAGTWAGRRT